MAKNLFDKAKQVTSTKKSSKDQKVRITVEDPSFYDKVEKLEELQEVMKSVKARADMISDELREVGKSEWSKLYEKTRKNPGSVMLEHIKNDNVSQLMFITADKYLTVTKERAEELTETFGEDIIEEKTTFAFDNEMIEKYGEILSELIEKSDIPEKDKEKIIKASTVFSIKKGTIDDLPKYGDVAEVMEAVKPVISLKNVEIIKG
jgi:hypothetical protein